MVSLVVQPTGWTPYFTTIIREAVPECTDVHSFPNIYIYLSVQSKYIRIIALNYNWPSLGTNTRRLACVTSLCLTSSANSSSSWAKERNTSYRWLWMYRRVSSSFPFSQPLLVVTWGTTASGGSASERDEGFQVWPGHETNSQCLESKAIGPTWWRHDEAVHCHYKSRSTYAVANWCGSLCQL